MGKKRKIKKKINKKNNSLNNPNKTFLGIVWGEETKFYIIYFFSFLNGAFLGAGGLVLENFIIFSIGLGVLYFSFSFGVDKEGKKEAVKLNNKFALLYFVIILLCSTFFFLTKDALFSSLFVLISIIIILRQSLKENTLFSVFLFSTSLLIEGAFFVILGLRTQLDKSLLPLSSHAWSVLFLGIASSSILSSYYVLKNIKVLKDAGLKKSKKIKNKKGKEVLRPLGICRIYSLLLICGVALLSILAILGKVPLVFSLMILLLSPITNLANDFLYEKRSIPSLIEKTLNIGIFTIGAEFILIQLYFYLL